MCAPPQYNGDSFDCDDEVLDFLAFIRRENARSGKALPAFFVVVGAHALMGFVGTGPIIKFFDVRLGEVSESDVERPQYLGVV